MKKLDILEKFAKTNVFFFQIYIISNTLQYLKTCEGYEIQVIQIKDIQKADFRPPRRLEKL